jgi:hypothetical protein
MRDEPPFDADQRYAADPRYGTDPYPGHDPYRMAAPEQEEHYDDPRADYGRDRPYAAGGDYHEEPMFGSQQRRGGYADDALGGMRARDLDAHHHMDAQGVGARGMSARDADAHDMGARANAYNDEDYDDPPRRARSGSSLVTAVILIGCAMLGTAGAYGYRTYNSGSTQAPVITADSAPTKIVPAEQRSSRSQDRVATQGNDERLVSREEQPVALQPPGSSGVPRVVFPSPTTTGTTQPPGSSAQASAGNTEPKRVKTVPIRPEGGDTSGRPFNDEPARTAAVPPSRTAPQTVPAQRAPTRDQPLSLDPVQEPPRQQQRAAAPPAQREAPAQREPAAPRVAAVPPNAGSGASGGFVVQVSSQRSEADAQASYRALQGKYSQLKAHQPLIRRADLGQKGVYYRAMVGPFESGDEAVRFCNDLKQAGGQCIIHRN